MATYTELGTDRLDEVLAAVGDLLQAQSESVSIVVVGGASLSLLGLVRRTTGDVDVIARLAEEEGEATFVRPDPFPKALTDAIETVARDFGLPSDWMNTTIAGQWDLGLPPRLQENLTWRDYGGLRVGLVGRPSLIALKLFATIDQSPQSVHYQDLLALAPTEEELGEAASWVRSQDASLAFSEMTDQVISHVRRDLDRN